MTTYQRKGGQYRTRSGSTAYRRGVKGQRAAPTVRRSARRFYRRHTVPCLVVGGLGLILAWHAAPFLVLAGAGMLAVPYAVDGVKKVKSAHQTVKRTQAAWDAKRAQWKAAGVALATQQRSVSWRKFEFKWEPTPKPAASQPDHHYTPGSPPLFLCGSCNEPHRKRTAA